MAMHRYTQFLTPLAACTAILLFGAACADSASLPVEAAARKGEGLQFFEEAATMAAGSGKPIMLVFTGKNTDGRFWCPPCAALDRSIFESESFQEWAKEHVVKLEIILPRDSWPSEKLRDHNLALQEQYGIRSVPTVVFTDAAGTVLGTNPSRRSAETWIEEASKIIAQK